MIRPSAEQFVEAVYRTLRLARLRRWRPMRNHALTAVALVLVASRPGWSQGQDLSGHMDDDRFGSDGACHVHITPGGWGQFAVNQARSGLSITVAQTSEAFTVTFPGGAHHLLTTSVPAAGPSPHTTVVDKGEWWVKYLTAAHWSASSVELTSTTSTGWWRSADPESASGRATDFEKRIALTLDPDANHLSLRVTLSDEKGQLEYVQRLRRTGGSR